MNDFYAQRISLKGIMFLGCPSEFQLPSFRQSVVPSVCLSHYGLQSLSLSVLQISYREFTVIHITHVVFRHLLIFSSKVKSTVTVFVKTISGH